MSDTCRSQFNRQRQPIEATAQIDHRGTVLHGDSEVMPRRLRPFGKQAHCLNLRSTSSSGGRTSGRGDQVVDGTSLARDMQYSTARDEHRQQRARQEVADQRPHRGDARNYPG